MPTPPASQTLTAPPLAATVTQAWPPAEWVGVNTLVAVSGGADSVALLRAMVELAATARGPGRLIAAHFNHGLRGDESDADEQWVGALALDLGVPFVSQRWSTTGGHASEESARDARYAFLKQAAADAGARFVATAHTADDQAETVLLRVLRGSGLAGLAAIPRRRPLDTDVTLVRPLLGASRRQVEAYLATLDQPFRTDRTNADPRYTRNWVRQTLMPQLAERLGAGVTKALLGLSEHAAETHALMTDLAGTLRKEAITHDAAAGRMTVDPARFAGRPPLLAREACRLAWREAGWPEQAMTREHWRRLGAIVAGDGLAAVVVLPGAIRVEKVGGAVVLTRS